MADFVSQLRCTRLLLMLGISACLTACGSDSPGHVSPTPVSLQAQHSSAVTDARTAEPAEISRYLTPINNENPNLIWENGVVGSRADITNAMTPAAAAATSPVLKGAIARLTSMIPG
ncbi:MAG: hypothetical protein HIU83_15535 [Proteobacteria bacterium]|nr:hypothetical protein [Pseudomonadota bacterium]